MQLVRLVAIRKHFKLKPQLVCLYGLTCTGKTDLLNKLPNALDLEDLDGVYGPTAVPLLGRYDTGQHGALFEALGLKQGAYYVSVLGCVEIILAFMLILGLYTQLAALVTLLISLAAYYLKGTHGAHIEHRRHLFFLTAVISLSLLLSGAGALGFALPL